jgi:hypothetical protein
MTLPTWYFVLYADKSKVPKVLHSWDFRCMQDGLESSQFWRQAKVKGAASGQGQSTGSLQSVLKTVLWYATT